MAIRTVEKVINGKQYTFNTWGASKGLNILKKVTKILGPSVMSLVTDGGSGNVELLKEAVKEMAFNMDNEDIGALVKDILQDVKINNAPPVPSFDMYYSGEYKELFQAIFEVLKENYESFLGKGGLAG